MSRIFVSSRFEMRLALTLRLGLLDWTDFSRSVFAF
jgi:hypothetical protein